MTDLLPLFSWEPLLEWLLREMKFFLFKMQCKIKVSIVSLLKKKLIIGLSKAYKVEEQ